jgi:demethoxyubiquinone hydroxylase (CLK1/Coq7/Cat5 family)
MHWSLGFLAETERQVEGHLEGHKARLPAQDRKSWEVLEQMKPTKCATRKRRPATARGNCRGRSNWQ